MIYKQCIMSSVQCSKFQHLKVTSITMLYCTRYASRSVNPLQLRYMPLMSMSMPPENNKRQTMLCYAHIKMDTRKVVSLQRRGAQVKKRYFLGLPRGVGVESLTSRMPTPCVIGSSSRVGVPSSSTPPSTSPSSSSSSIYSSPSSSSSSSSSPS